MLQTKIDETVSVIMGMYAEFVPGNGFKFQVIEAQATKKGIPRQQFVNVANLLLLNDYLTMPDDGRISYFIRLTDKGYAFIKGEESILLSVNFAEMIDFAKMGRDKSFYSLWDYIGDGDKDTNPFYVTGPQFFNTCKEYIKALPPTYSEYIRLLEEKNGKKPTRSQWCKELFAAISESDLQSFLEKLSLLVNNNTSQSRETKDDDIEQKLVEQQTVTIMAMPKIFISHNEDDAAFAHALVDLMISIGMKYEDIFCSSHPACSIPFGKSILNTMRKQFDDYSLTVLFIHSPRLYASPVSLCEMGAAWILRTNIFSFLTKDCEFSMLKGVVKDDDTAFKAGQENTYRVLNDFRRFLEKEFRLNPIPDNAWDFNKQKFIDAVNNIDYSK